MPIALRSQLDSLQWQAEEHFAPGDKVEAIIGLPADLNATELSTLEAKLKASGLDLIDTVALGATPEWPNALRIRFRRPLRMKGAAFLPLAVMLVLALGAIGITGIVGWKIGDVIGSIGQSLLPIALITAGTIIAVAYVKSK